VLFNRVMSAKTYTTQQAADAAGITRATLQDWIKRGKCAAPKLQRLGSVSARLWKASDVARLKATKKQIYQVKRPKKIERPRSKAGS
jgi:predicted DNA-binding transcriptional regulator AlpA